MEVKRIRFFVACFFYLYSLRVTAQDSSIQHIDPSKPTNLYNRWSNNFEYNFLRNGKRTFGYRANLVWATTNQHHSAQMELPLLYATSSKKFGLGDIRFRYYWIPYRNYEKKPGAFGIVIDSYLPTGGYSEGLGRGRWIASAGISTAFVFGNFSTFPIISYLYSGKIATKGALVAGGQELIGYMFQTILVYRFNKRSYLDCTPIFMKNSYTNSGHDDFVVESNYLYMVRKNKIQVGYFLRRYFRGGSTTVRAAMRIYF